MSNSPGDSTTRRLSWVAAAAIGITALAMTAGAAPALDDEKAPPPKRDAETTRDRTTTPARQQVDPAELERRREAAREALRQRHEEALRNPNRSVDTGLQPTTRPDGIALDTSRTAPGAQSENRAVKLEPAILDFGDMKVDVSQTGVVKVMNISEEPITVSRVIASCGCTTAPAPTDPILPGEYAEIPVTLAPGGRQGVNHSKRVTFTIEGHAPVVLTVQGRVAKHIDIVPELLSANPEDPDSGRIALTAADGEAFRILAINPAIVRDVPQEAATEHVVNIDWDLWERSGRGVRVTFSLDHPAMPAVSAMIRPRLRPGETPTRPEPAIAPINANTNRLIAAAKVGDVDTMDAALRAGAIVDEADRATGRTALHWAAREGHAEAIEALLLTGAAVDVEDRTGKTALSTAAEAGRADAVRILLEKGAAVNHRDRIGGSPLLWAAGLGNVETVEVLLAHDADVTVADTNGLTPLLWAAGIGDPRSVEQLLKADADPTTRDRLSGDDAIIRAARSGKDETVEILIKHGVRLDSRNNVGMTPLLMAASAGSLQKVTALAEANAALDAKCNRGWTALEHARNRIDAQRDAIVAYLESKSK